VIAALQGSSVERFRVMVARRLGLQFDDSKLEFLSEVLSKHAEPDDLHSPPEVAQQDRPLITATEVSKLAEDLTVAETYFFRNIEQFRVLGEIAMPELLQVRDRRRPLRILSAGCSSGEEAYSIAMTVDERFPHLSRREVEIEGVDIVPSRIERARLARYPPWSLRETQENVKALWFQK
jgi:chemotaxis protein methyltransferase CheR